MLSWNSTIGAVQSRALAAKRASKSRPLKELNQPKLKDTSIQLIKLLGIPSSTDNNNRIVYMLYKPPPPAIQQPYFLVHFHGIGQQLSDLPALVRKMGDQFQVGILAVEYPGFGMAEEYEPSETIIYEDAKRAIAFLQNNLKIPNERIFLQGYSLGTGIASELAYRGLGSKLILLAPYLSVPEMASTFVPILPTSIANWLIQDKIDTKRKAPCVSVNVIIVHGTNDEIVPYWMGKRLSKLFPCATLESMTCADHYLLKKPYLAKTLKLIQNFIEQPASVCEKSKDVKKCE